MRIGDPAFDAGECAACLELVTGVVPDDAEVEAVMGATEGWPLAVGAIGLSMRRRLPGPSRFAGESRGSIAVRSPPEICEFLVDMPVPGDYDGDGDGDPAVYRPSSACGSRTAGRPWRGARPGTFRFRFRAPSAAPIPLGIELDDLDRMAALSGR